MTEAIAGPLGILFGAVLVIVIFKSYSAITREIQKRREKKNS